LDIDSYDLVSRVTSMAPELFRERRQVREAIVVHGYSLGRWAELDLFVSRYQDGCTERTNSAAESDKKMATVFGISAFEKDENGAPRWGVGGPPPALAGRRFYVNQPWQRYYNSTVSVDVRNVPRSVGLDPRTASSAELAHAWVACAGLGLWRMEKVLRKKIIKIL
jgi:hypothetical protein